MTTLYKLSLITLMLCLALQATSQNTPNQVAYGNDWVAVDGAGRKLPSFTEVGDHKNGRYIGIFYWLWHAYIRTHPIRNMTEELRRTNGNPNFVAQDWYWAEPENGYYHNSDPWVARRHLQLLADAGVDFIYIDYTNGNQGSDSFDSFMSVALDMQNKGIPVPRFVFFINDDGGRTAMDFVYNNIYKPGKYQSLWFYWEGKPLIMEGSIHASSNEIRNFFTFRDTWAFQESTTDQWRFIDNYPQRPSYHNGVAEQICVNKSMGAPLISVGAVNDKGSSYTTTTGTPPYNAVWETARMPYGDYFEQQWGRVHEVNPPIVCVTGWNEWTAGQWQSTEPTLQFMGKPCSQIGWYMVDEFNVEFNRDLEPMKGEYTDNYYYQLVNHIRQYKGMARAQAPSAAKTISIDGNFTEWNTVSPVYKDPLGDTQNRNFKNVDNSGTYTNTTGRNDIVESRVTNDATNIYFYAKTDIAISPWTGSNWMLLFIDSDRNKSTGWEGYDYVVNQGVNSATQTTIKKWVNNGWSQIGTCVINVAGNQLEIAVPKTSIGLSSSVNIYFHWADNMQVLNDITQFFINGESAPNRRFNYEYISASATSQTPYGSVINIPGIIEAENFDNGGEGIAYHDNESSNKSGAMRPSEGVDIEACSEGGNNIDWSNNGEWLEYSVNVTQTGSYRIDTRVASPIGGSFHIEFDNVNVTGAIPVPNTGGWQNWQTVSKTVTLSAGQHIMRFFIDQKEFNTNNFTFVIDQTPFAGIINLPGTIEAENFDNGGEGISYHDTEADNLGSENRISEAVDMQTCSEGGFDVGWTSTGEWLEYTVSVNNTQSYTLDARIASPNNGASFHIDIDGANLTGTTAVPNTGGWQNWQTVSKIINLTAGQHILRFTIDGGGFNLNKIVVSNASAGARIFTDEETSVSAEPALTISPNPAQDHVTVTWKGMGKAVKLNVINAQGYLVHSNNLNGAEEYLLSTSSYNTGMFIISVQSEKMVIRKKLLISR